MEVVKHSIFPGKEGLADEGVVRLFGYRWSATDCSTVGGIESPSPSISLTLSDEYPLMEKGLSHGRFISATHGGKLGSSCFAGGR